MKMKLHDSYFVRRRSSLGDIFRDALTCVGVIVGWIFTLVLGAALFIAVWVITP